MKFLVCFSVGRLFMGNVVVRFWKGFMCCVWIIMVVCRCVSVFFLLSRFFLFVILILSSVLLLCCRLCWVIRKVVMRCVLLSRYVLMDVCVIIWGCFWLSVLGLVIFGVLLVRVMRLFVMLLICGIFCWFVVVLLVLRWILFG